MAKRADKVLTEAYELLKGIEKKGLFSSLSEGVFAQIKRGENEGRGLDGVFKKSQQYVNPFIREIKKELEAELEKIKQPREGIGSGIFK